MYSDGILFFVGHRLMYIPTYLGELRFFLPQAWSYDNFTSQGE